MRVLASRALLREKNISTEPVAHRSTCDLTTTSVKNTHTESHSLYTGLVANNK